MPRLDGRGRSAAIVRSHGRIRPAATVAELGLSKAKQMVVARSATPLKSFAVTAA